MATQTPSPAPVAVPVPVPVVTPTPADHGRALTYVATSAEFAFASALNSFRSQIGLGLLAQNAFLDKSAQNHLQYVLANDPLKGGTVDMRSIDPVTGRSMFHIENAANKRFTGVEEFERAKFAAYHGVYAGEELTFAGGKGGKVGFGFPRIYRLSPRWIDVRRNS